MSFPQRVADEDDPRMTAAYVWWISDGGGTVTLVDVVHDHPSSTCRVKRTIEELDPDVLALALPPISIPLFERYARDEREPPLFDGEMSATIQTARPGSRWGSTARHQDLPGYSLETYPRTLRRDR